MAKTIYFTIYRIINSINQKEYIGKHTTIDLNDYYFGSGEAIKDAIKKYGRDNFVKEILFLAFDEESMEWVESQIVNNEYVDREDTYNLIVGGRHNRTGNSNGKRGPPKGSKNGSGRKGKHYGYIQKKKKTEDTKRKISLSLTGKLKWITNKIDEKVISKNDVIPNGWIPGRMFRGPMSELEKEKRRKPHKSSI